ncbi:hypothetical protein CFC21_021636 [Triticum aestivum]|uniref:Uncharacterized protein n=2 Tax=Triticum aestivum TaxID=4565 RepID=A0A9R1EAL5_WHEAT|nr:hypothetical protein CFC21_021636 [Triticum aestivum]
MGGGGFVSTLRWLRDTGAALRSPYDLLRGWPGLLLDHPAVDAVLWGLVTAVESVAIAAMVCAFFLCCGCAL